MKLNADTDSDLPRLNRLNGSLAGEIFYGRWPKTSRAMFKMQARQVSPPLRAGFSRLLSGDPAEYGELPARPTGHEV
jgi:hypothetical protein